MESEVKSGVVTQAPPATAEGSELRTGSEADAAGWFEDLTYLIPLAEEGAFLLGECSYSYVDGREQPSEFSISWEWQQSKPHTSGLGEFRAAVDKWLADCRENELDLPVLRAREAIKAFTRNASPAVLTGLLAAAKRALPYLANQVATSGLEGGFGDRLAYDALEEAIEKTEAALRKAAPASTDQNEGNG